MKRFLKFNGTTLIKLKFISIRRTTFQGHFLGLINRLRLQWLFKALLLSFMNNYWVWVPWRPSDRLWAFTGSGQGQQLCALGAHGDTRKGLGRNQGTARKHSDTSSGTQRRILPRENHGRNTQEGGEAETVSWKGILNPRLSEHTIVRDFLEKFIQVRRKHIKIGLDRHYEIMSTRKL